MLLCVCYVRYGIVILNVHRILQLSFFYIVDVITVADDAWRHFFFQQQQNEQINKESEAFPFYILAFMLHI